MKNSTSYTNKCILLIIFSLFTAPPLFARDTLLTFDFESAVQRGYDESILDRNISFKLAGQEHSAVINDLGEYKTSKKTNGVGKSDEKACNWVLLSALKTLQEKAKSLGANAVINIKSNYKNNEYISATKYQCGAGNILAGVALKGTAVEL